MGLAAKTELVLDLTLNILVRLPVKPLTRFKSVCKEWNLLISNRKFTREHLKTMAVIEAHHDFILHDFVLGAFYARILSNSYGDDQSQQDQIEATKLQNCYCDRLPRNDPTKLYVFIGHCDGLLCLVKQCSKAWLHVLLLWNPSIRELKRFSLPTGWKTSSWEVLGFGYDSSADDYKLIRVSNNNHHPGSGVSDYSDIEVLSLRNNSVRTAEKGLSYSGKSRQKSVFSHGCLYFLARKPSDSEINHGLILCFDLAKQKLREISPPPCSEEADSSKLSLLHGSLCMVRHNNGDIHVWVMKEDGTNKSWMKQFRFPEIPNYGRIWRPFPFPICYIKEDEVLVSVDNKKFFLYNTKDESYQKLTVHGSQYWVNVIPYMESLVSPYKIVQAIPSYRLNEVSVPLATLLLSVRKFPTVSVFSSDSYTDLQSSNFSRVN